MVGVFVYDAMGRLTSQTDWASTTVVAYSRTVTYNAKGQVVQDDVSAWQGGALYRSLSDYTYGTGANYALGAVTEVIAQNWKDGAVWPTTKTTTAYDWYDGAITMSVIVDPDNNAATNNSTGSSYVYHVIGGQARLHLVDIQDGRPRKVWFAADMLGQVFRRDEADNLIGGDPHEVWYRYGGRQQGYVGNNGAMDVAFVTSVAHKQSPPGQSSFADFDLAYDAINAYEQGGRGGVYTVQSGDTLTGIASALWGDASLWWKLAEVNGLTAESTLVEGQLLIIPVGVQTNANNASTFQPYDPLEVLGNLSPTAPKPAKGKNCGALGAILLAVIAIVVTIASGGWAGGVANSLGFATGTAGNAIVGGAIAGAAGSVASQTVGVATGIQERFSWNAVALSAIGGGVGGSGIGEAVSGAVGGGAMGAFASGAVSNAITQGIGVATGLQKEFSWAGVAAAGVGSAVFKFVSDRMPGAEQSHTYKKMNPATGQANVTRTYTPATAANRFIASGASLIADAATRSLIDGSDFGDNIMAGLPNVIGQAIGSAIAEGIASRGSPGAMASADESGAPRNAKQLAAQCQVAGQSDEQSAARQEAEARLRERMEEFEELEAQVAAELGPEGRRRLEEELRSHNQLGAPAENEGKEFGGGVLEGVYIAGVSAVTLDPFYGEAYDMAHPPTSQAQADGRALGNIIGFVFGLRAARSQARVERPPASAATGRLTPRMNVADQFTLVRTRADGSRFYTYGRTNRGHGIDINVDAEGIVGINVRSSGRGASGTDMVLSGMQRLEADGVQVNGIRGLWLRDDNSVNYREFMANVDRMTPQQAAANTWTGRLAARMGYTEISPPIVHTSRVPVPGLPNTPYRVEVYFRRPPQ